MSFPNLWLYSGLLILGLMFVLWTMSLALKNASIVDVFWGMSFVITYWFGGLILPGEMTERATLIGVIVTIWGLRLSIYIWQRNYGKPEDFRYAKWRKEGGEGWWWHSLFKVFILQGALIWIIAIPLLAVHINSISVSALNWLDFLGVFIWLIGFVFEAGGDYQLARFKADPINQGKLLTTGLWSLTRHPNYFGDATQWWGFYLIALASGAWRAIFSPIIMTFLLLKVSGVVMLERTLKETKPGYAEYIARTSSFFPWFRKK